MNFNNIDDNRKYSQFKSAGRIRECFYCKERKALEAHSISRARCLSILQEEIAGNSCVYGFDAITLNYAFGLFRGASPGEFKPVGINKASTFTGFCSEHDRELFDIIDNFDFIPESLKQYFVYCYRAFARAYHKKREEVKSCTSCTDYATQNAGYVLNRTEECRVGLSIDLGDYPELINNWLIREEFDNLYHYHLQTQVQLPIASASFIQPSFDILEHRINDYKVRLPLNHIFLNIIPEEKTTHILISCFKSQRKSIQFIESLKAEYNRGRINLVGVFLTNLLVFYSENTFIRPSFINQMDYFNKQRLILNLRNSITDDIQNYYLDNPIREDMNFFNGVL